MAKELSKQQQAIHTVLEKFKQPFIAAPGVERQIVLDDENQHYQVLSLGWNELIRTFTVLVHMDIQKDLIWVQVDNTEPGVVEALLELGIPKEEIVLGFQAPFKRPFTGFATGE